MSIHELLRDNYSITQAKSLQEKYQRIIQRKLVDHCLDDIKDIHTIVGVDISYYTSGNIEYGIGCAVLWNLDLGIMEKKAFYRDAINFPYKSGFLGFRECPLLAKLIKKLSFKPDLIMCDGHGIIHPRKFGEAVQLGFSLDIPSIGIAKKPYVGYSNWKKIEKEIGNNAPVWAKNPKSQNDEIDNELLGYAVCLNNGSNPVFVSVGYKITIDTALAICLATSQGHRQPEPLFMADHLSKKRVKDDLSKLKQGFDFKVT